MSYFKENSGIFQLKPYLLNFEDLKELFLKMTAAVQLVAKVG